MSTVDVFAIPKQVGFTELTSSGSTLLPSEMAKIVVEGQAFEIEGSPAASLALGKLRRMADGSRRLPDEWNVRSAQFSTLFDLLHSTK